METRKMIVGMIMLILVLMSGTARATQYYVSPDGSDNNSGTSWATAFETVGKGITTAGNGDTIDVNEGTYYETIDYDGKAIKVRSTDPNDWDVVAATIIDANNASSDAVTFDTGEDANSVLRGLTVTGATVGVYADGVGPVISRCILHGNRTGVQYTQNSTGTLIENNKIYDCNGYGVFGHKGDATIKNNWIYDSDKGIKLSAGASADIYNNTIVNNISYGIEKGGGQGSVTISNCIIWDCNDDLEGCSATYSCISDCNDASGTGNICGDGNDPNFVDADANDFHLEPDTPCIEAGDPCYVPDSGETDIDNNARIHGLTVDISADELSADWYVDDDRGSNGTGESWDTAFKYLQDALANSNLLSGDGIWVAQGIYKPTTSTTNRSASFKLKAGVIIKGGYAGLSESGPDRDIRDIHAYETILSGDIDGDEMLSGNSYHVVKAPYEQADGAVIDGFTITGGNATGSGTYDKIGGGILCYQTSPTINNCIITDNYAEGGGGGGGGMYILADVGHTCSPTVTNCFFIYNDSGTSGGGIWNDLCEMTVVNCVFAYNTAVYQGGGLLSNKLTADILNCTFAYNEAGSNGGGIHTVSNSTLDIYNSIFWGNKDTYDAGPPETWQTDETAQIYVAGSMPTVKYCCIEDMNSGGDFDSGDNTNNIDDDPGFTTVACPAGPDEILGSPDDCLALSFGNPCVDSGSNTAAAGIETDIIGAARILDGDATPGGIVDRGAYELFKPTVAEVRLYTNKQYSDNGGSGLDDCQVHFGHKEGMGSFAYPDLYIEMDATGGSSVVEDFYYFEVTSYSDPKGINVSFRETGVNTNKYRCVHPIHLATVSNQNSLELKVLDEETLYVYDVAGPMVDRGEVATITADTVNNCTNQVPQWMPDDTADAFDEFFDKDEGSDPYFWWDNGEQRAQCSTTFSDFIKNVGESSTPLPADFLISVSHGSFGSFGCCPDYTIHSPGSEDEPTVTSQDWDEDIEWAVIYACRMMGAFPLPQTYTLWDDALIRASNTNNCHGILSSSDKLMKADDGITHIELFCEAMKGNNKTVINAYMDTAADATVEQFAASALFHQENEEDYLNDVTADTDNTDMYYTWFFWSGSEYIREEITYTDDLGLQFDEWAKVVCDVPKQRPRLARLLVRKEAPVQEALDESSFDKAEFDDTGCIRFRKHHHGRGPLRLSKEQARTKAANFIARKGGGMPVDAELTTERQQKVATFDALDVENTWNEFVRKEFFEYTHKFNDIEIVGGKGGDSIVVTVAGDQVVGLKRHWRDIVGPAGSLQQVISASDALVVAVENIPTLILFPRDTGYSITEIKLFYYGLPSQEEYQYLTPAWGFEVDGHLWFYVNAFTGEFLD